MKVADSVGPTHLRTKARHTYSYVHAHPKIHTYRQIQVEDDLGGEESMITRIEIEITEKVDGEGEGEVGGQGQGQGPPMSPPGGEGK